MGQTPSIQSNQVVVHKQDIEDRSRQLLLMKERNREKEQRVRELEHKHERLFHFILNCFWGLIIALLAMLFWIIIHKYRW